MSDYLVILGFANQRTAERTLQKFADTRTSKANVLIVDNHYPVNVTEGFWKRAAQELGGTYLDPGRNIGLHEGLNYALREVQAGPADLMLGMDPDTNPLTRGWDTALINALGIANVGWASLGNNHSEGEMRERGHTPSTEGGLRLFTTLAPVVNSICGFKLNWVLSSGGFQEPSAFYGGLECAMWHHMSKTHYRWVFLRDFREGTWTEDLIDSEYRAYKWRHAHEGYPHDFETYIREGCP